MIFSLAVKVCIATVVQSAYGADILLQMVYVVNSLASKFSNGVVLTISNLLRAIPLYCSN